MKVYGVFSGQYSDWDVHGYFTDKDLAERYCALKNGEGIDYGSDYYYVNELYDLQSNVSGLENVKIKYYHKVTIPISGSRYGIPDNDPNNYREYAGENRQCKIGLYYDKYISFYINTNSNKREKAEKIALDLFNELKYLVEDFNDFELALRVLGSKHKYKVEIRK